MVTPSKESFERTQRSQYNHCLCLYCSTLFTRTVVCRKEAAIELDGGVKLSGKWAETAFCCTKNLLHSVHTRVRILCCQSFSIASSHWFTWHARQLVVDIVG
jgi:hypothetical protein